MAEDDKQSKAEDDKQSRKEEASSEATSVPLNKTPPAPPEKTSTANFSENQEESWVFLQAGGDSSDNKDDPSGNEDDQK
jgi:hypothetical protein